MHAGEWYAISQNVTPEPYHFDNPNGSDPCAKKYGVSLGCQHLTALDCVSLKILHFKVRSRVPGPYTSDEVLEFCNELFAKCGRPRGILLSPGLWKSSDDMLREEELRSRGKAFHSLGLKIPRMPRNDADRIETALSGEGFEVTWE